MLTETILYIIQPLPAQARHILQKLREKNAQSRSARNILNQETALIRFRNFLNISAVRSYLSQYTTEGT